MRITYGPKIIMFPSETISFLHERSKCMIKRRRDGGLKGGNYTRNISLLCSDFSLSRRCDTVGRPHQFNNLVGSSLCAKTYGREREDLPPPSYPPYLPTIRFTTHAPLPFVRSLVRPYLLSVDCDVSHNSLP